MCKFEILLFAISRYHLSSSNQMKLRFVLIHATAVVQLHINGSNIVSHSLEDVSIILSIINSGFCVGCSVFSCILKNGCV